MTTFSLRNVKLRTGEQYRDTVTVQLEPLVLGGQEYTPVPAEVPAELTITKATSGSVYQLSFRAELRGPCFRCLRDTVVAESVDAREYQATNPNGDEELETPYLGDDGLDLSAWARDALALGLPDKILHSPDCAGLCPVCGKDLNDEPHTHEELKRDPRWAALSELFPGSDASGV
ncbi:MAG TPA: DUF177 domain-containing protein [Gaiellaceae bacterium]|jgi:uncharacterized protein